MPFLRRIIKAGRAGALAVATLAIAVAGCSRPQTPATPEPIRLTETVTREVSAPLHLDEETRQRLDGSGRFLLGIEVEQDQSYPNLRARRVALVTDPTAIDQQGFHTLERLATTQLFSLVEVFLIDDGVTSSTLALDRALERTAQMQTPPRIHRIDRDNWQPQPSQFLYVDAILWDATLRGPRVTVDAAALGAFLEFASLHAMRFVVADRPPIMGRRTFEGPPADVEFAGTRLAYFPIAPYPALTAGELASLYNQTFGLMADLRVRRMTKWNRLGGAEWLSGDPGPFATPVGAEMRREVAGGPIFAPGMVELLAASELAGERLWRFTELRLANGGIPELLLAPREMGAVTLMERLSNLEPMGVDFLPHVVTIDGEDVGALLIRPSGDMPVDFLQLAMALQFSSMPNPREPGEDHELHLFGSAFITQGLTSGLTPDRVRRRWLTSPQYRSFQNLREGALLYQP